MDNCPRRVAVLLKCLDDNAYDLTFLVLCQISQRRPQRVFVTFGLSKLHEALIRIERQESRRVVLELLVKLKKEIRRNPIDVEFLAVAGLEPERAGRSGDRVVAVLYISPKKFIYFLKHPEDPDFRAFRYKFPSSATAKTTSL